MLRVEDILNILKFKRSLGTVPISGEPHIPVCKSCKDGEHKCEDLFETRGFEVFDAPDTGEPLYKLVTKKIECMCPQCWEFVRVRRNQKPAGQ